MATTAINPEAETVFFASIACWWPSFELIFSDWGEWPWVVVERIFWMGLGWFDFLFLFLFLFFVLFDVDFFDGEWGGAKWCSVFDDIFLIWLCYIFVTILNFIGRFWTLLNDFGVKVVGGLLLLINVVEWCWVSILILCLVMSNKVFWFWFFWFYFDRSLPCDIKIRLIPLNSTVPVFHV